MAERTTDRKALFRIPICVKSACFHALDKAMIHSRPMIVRNEGKRACRSINHPVNPKSLCDVALQQVRSLDGQMAYRCEAVSEAATIERFTQEQKVRL
jgi:hypothetical protein